jgi:hypothetical protein
MFVVESGNCGGGLRQLLEHANNNKRPNKILRPAPKHRTMADCRISRQRAGRRQCFLLSLAIAVVGFDNYWGMPATICDEK